MQFKQCHTRIHHRFKISAYQNNKPCPALPLVSLFFSELAVSSRCILKEGSGSIMLISTSESSFTAFSIIGRTTFQSRPPSPHPSGGIVTDLMHSSLITLTRSASPDRMSSIRLFPFQCLFVGKLIIYFFEKISPAK